MLLLPGKRGCPVRKTKSQRQKKHLSARRIAASFFGFRKNYEGMLIVPSGRTCFSLPQEMSIFFMGSAGICLLFRHVRKEPFPSASPFPPRPCLPRGRAGCEVPSSPDPLSPQERSAGERPVPFRSRMPPRRSRALRTGRRCRPAFCMPAVLRERRFCAQDGDGMRGFAAPSVLYREGGS